MASKALPCPTVLRQLLRYEPDTGKLFWRTRSEKFFTQTNRTPAIILARQWNTKYAGREAFTSNLRRGYKSGMIFNRRLSAHRVIWAIETGCWPDGEIDHINGRTDDNRIANLRDVSRAENCKNMKLHKSNKSGICGVHWNSKDQIWRATIYYNKKQIRLGSYGSAAEAADARKAAEVKYKYHKNHGRIL